MMASVIESTLGAGRIAVLRLRNPPANGLSHAVRSQFMDCLAKWRSRAEAVVVMGGHGMFSCGADINEFMQGSAGPVTLRPDLLEVIAAVDESPLPVVAALQGTCLGGGMELAMACHYRIATPDLRMGLPEVHLGLLPGAGGTQRLPRLVGVEAALDLMCTGRMVGASDAMAAGMVDAVLDVGTTTTTRDSGEFEDATEKYVVEHVLGDGAPPLADLRVSQRSLPVAASPQAFDAAEEKFTRTPAHAPASIIEAVRACTAAPTFEEGLQRERELFQVLFDSPQAAALRHMFFAERATTKGIVPQGVVPKSVSQVAVIGCGTMGGGIAMAMIDAGIPVALIDRDAATLDAGIARVSSTYKRSSKYRSGALTDDALADKLALLSPSTDFADVGSADVVIEAAFERMAVKKEVFTHVVQHAKPDAVLATNTSTLDVDEIAQSTGCPERVVGTHFFSPANVMKLLENVRGAHSSDEAVATVMDLGKRIGKIPVLAGNCFGFIGNRMLEG